MTFDSMEWIAHANCRNRPDLNFFPDQPDIPVDIRIRRCCTICVVRAQCKTWALHHENHGIWAGLNVQQLQAERRRQHVTYTPITPPDPYHLKHKKEQQPA